MFGNFSKPGVHCSLVGKYITWSKSISYPLPFLSAKNSLLRIVKSYVRWNNCWNIDCDLRYTAARAALSGIKSDSICEIGPGNAGLGQLIQTPVIGFDITFDAVALRRWNQNLRPVTASMNNLPLRCNSFDAVLALDCLEHIPTPQRQDALAEFMRVAKCRLVFSVPCGSTSGASDQQLYEHYQRRWGQSCMWLKEHIEFGLPEMPEVMEMIHGAGEQTGKQVEIQVKNHMPLLVHNFNHRVLMTANYRLARPLSYLLWLVYPFLRKFSRQQTYRKFFIVRLSNDETKSKSRPSSGL